MGNWREQIHACEWNAWYACVHINKLAARIRSFAKNECCLMPAFVCSCAGCYTSLLLSSHTSMWPAFMNKTSLDPWWKNISLLLSTIFGARGMAPCWVCSPATGSLVAWNRRWQARSFTGYFTNASLTVHSYLTRFFSRDFASHSRILWQACLVNIAFMKPLVSVGGDI